MITCAVRIKYPNQHVIDARISRVNDWLDVTIHFIVT